MQQKQRIRVLALGMISRVVQNSTQTTGLFPEVQLLVHKGYDSVKQQTFYRALGGGVDFGESSLQALQREFQEEIQAKLINIQYLGCIENRFIYEGKPGHELIQLYRCDFADANLYTLDQIQGQEGDQTFVTDWVSVERFRSGELNLVPAACLQYL